MSQDTGAPIAANRRGRSARERLGGGWDAWGLAVAWLAFLTVMGFAADGWFGAAVMLGFFGGVAVIGRLLL